MARMLGIRHTVRVGAVSVALAVVTSCSAGSQDTAAGPGSVPLPAQTYSGQVSISDCPSTKAVGGLVGQAVQQQGDPGISAQNGVSCLYWSLEVEHTPNGAPQPHLAVDVESLVSGGNGTYYPTLAAAKQALEQVIKADKCAATCFVTMTPSFGPGAFEAYGPVSYPELSTRSCEEWIRDQEGRVVYVGTEVSQVEGVSSEMSAAATCGWAQGMAEMMMR